MAGNFWITFGGETQTTNAAGNTSTVSANMYINWAANEGYIDHATSWSINIGGNVKNSGSYQGSYGTGWGGSAGSALLGSHSVIFTHDANTGTRGAVGISGSLSTNTSPSYLPGTISGTGATQGALDYDRTPTTPTVTTSTRNSAGTTFSVSSWSGSVNNSGPAVTWTLQRATDSGFTANLIETATTTTSGTTLSYTGLNANTTYYFRLKASNADTSGQTNPKYSTTITSYGVPGPPTGLTVTPSTTDAGKVALSWTAPANTQGGISRYDIFVNDVFVESTTGTSLTSIKSTSANAALAQNTSYNFRVAAKNATNLSETAIANLSACVTTNTSVKAPGPPIAPTWGASPIIKVGRNVTVTVNNDANGINANTPVTAYYVQYRNATTSGGTYSAWSTPQLMSLSGSNYTYTYVLLDAALWYKFRVYAKNTIINTVAPSTGTVTRAYYPDNNISYTANFTADSTALFVSAGGKRYRGTGEANAGTFQPTEVAKRYGQTSAPGVTPVTYGWIDLTIAKRYDGTNWIELT